MSVKSYYFGDVFADTFTGVGSGLTGIDLSTAIAPLGANSVVITNGLGMIATETQLAVSRGGTGADLSGATGGAQLALTNTDGTIANGPAIAQYGATPTTLPVRAVGTGFIHDSAGFECDGLGDPSVPTWGKMISDAYTGGAAVHGYWWWILLPAFLIMITASAFAFIGYALDKVVNPRLRER